MAGKHRRTLVWLLLLSSSAMIHAQPEHFARLSVYPAQVVAGQSLQVTISVYTTTWFTKAPDFGEYQVPNSFTVRTDRPQSTYETINGKRFTTLNYEYMVFPMSPGPLELPAMKVTFESPEEGDYKGKPVTVKTNAVSLQIDPVPDKPEGVPFFVAEEVRISEEWSKPLTGLKTGDVLDRTIRIEATATLAHMIPPLQQDSVSWAGIYPKIPVLSQTILENTVDASRIEKFTFLLEKPGTFFCPEINVHYFHPDKKIWKSVKLESREIRVADNPDLQVLITLQDSLTMLAAEGGTPSGKKSRTFLGYSLKELSVGLLVLLIVAVSLVFGIRKGIAGYQAMRKAYIGSEKYLFKKILHAIQRDNLMQVNTCLYDWISLGNPSCNIIRLSDLATITGVPELEKDIYCLHRFLFGGSTDEHSEMTRKELLHHLKVSVSKARKRLIENNLRTNRGRVHLNP